ncbi:membrane protein FAM174 precursor [Xenopus tropicalis]|uniref:membrane protein FAM174 precursor n=1 Tax=Xenopus tropicalis TaxID=8364 RepID=UPI0000509D06|nr:membrane protein FAM174 precursor [Xenopus tropicalis]CAJ82108.1 Novel Protein [Xenopus tropicalis]|eukprot:NP_001017124.1 membrane protein FAM174 precursor [Xenopus tropicalis]
MGCNSYMPQGSAGGMLLVLLAFCLLGDAGCALSPPAASPALPTAHLPLSPRKGSNSSTAAGAPLATVPSATSPNKPRTQRALVVLVLVSAAVIIYFVIRTMRTRRKNKKTRKYGVLDTNLGNMELTPLEQDDEDDDTLFDANQSRR